MASCEVGPAIRYLAEEPDARIEEYRKFSHDFELVYPLLDAERCVVCLWL